MSLLHSVLIALDDPLLADSLVAALAASFRVTGPVTSLAALDAELTLKRPCAAVVDVVLEGHSVLAALERLVVRFPGTRFVVCTDPLEIPVAEAARLAGAVAAIDQARSLKEVAAGLERLCAGEPWAMAGEDGLPVATQRIPPSEPLSHREVQTLRLLQGGRKYRDIARVLEVEPKTVERFVGSLRRKYGLPKAQRVDWNELMEARENE